MKESENEKTPLLEWLLDNMWLLFFLGIGIYAVSYIIWGWLEIAFIPPMPEEIKNLYTK